MEGYLRANFPRDVLMPVRPGEKAPMFPHKNGVWSWDAYDRARARNQDVCVLLTELCVVDVDSRELAAELEARFPALREAPMEQTSRGAHYWFSRTPEADRDGHYDARSPCIEGVDFKTRCRNGTSGVVVIAPSSGRKWVREPGRGREIPPIPTDLLAAVSKPSHLKVRRRFVFASGDDAELEVAHLDAMSYFEPFLDDSAFDPEDPVVVPEERETFELLIRALEHGDFGNVAPTPDRVGAVLRAAEKLGLESEERRRLMTGPLLWAADTYRVCPGLFAKGEPVDVTEDIKYEPLPEDDTFLFREIAPELNPGDVVVSADEALDLRDNLPAFVRGLLEDFPLVLAGGSVLGMLTDAEFHDYDLFPVMADSGRATEMVEEIRRRAGDNVTVRQTGCAITFIFESEIECDDDVCQVILRLYDNPAHVLDTFDNVLCKVGAWVEDGRFRVAAMPAWFAAARHCMFPVDLRCWSGASVMRTLKYVAKGFDCFLPGLRRTALSSRLEWGEGRHLASLLFLDKKRSDERFTLSELQSLMKRPTDESEYNLYLKVTSRLLYAVKAMARWLGIRREQPQRPLQWARCGDGNRAFFKLSPRVSAAYEHPMYETLIESGFM